MRYCIADTILQVDLDEKDMHEHFAPYKYEGKGAMDMLVKIANQETIDIADAIKVTVGQLDLIQAKDYMVVEGAEGIDIIYTKHKYLTSVRIVKGFSVSELYLVMDDGGIWRDELYRAMKDIVYVAMEVKGRFVIESTSMLYKERAILFSVDRERKLMNLCEKHGLGECLNEDNNVIGIRKGRIYVYGTPWSGEKHIDAERRPMGGIIFVKKSKSDKLAAISKDRRQMLMFIRCQSPLWREGFLDMFIKPMQRIEPAIWIRQLQHPINDAAVKLIKEELDIEFPD